MTWDFSNYIFIIIFENGFNIKTLNIERNIKNLNYHYHRIWIKNNKQHSIFNWKVFIVPRVAGLLIHKDKQRGCPLLDANKHTHIYIIYLFETIVSSLFLIELY